MCPVSCRSACFKDDPGKRTDVMYSLESVGSRDPLPVDSYTASMHSMDGGIEVELVMVEGPCHHVER